jgi:hypothetical protein
VRLADCEAGVLGDVGECFLDDAERTASYHKTSEDLRMIDRR